MNPEKPPKYIAVIEDVRDVSLTGLADAAHWASLLRPVDLQLARKFGKAQVLLSAVQARYMGVAFRELSLSVFVRHPEHETTGNCLYLVCAFNSSRMFALVERTFFQTPYSPARIDVDAQLPVSFAAHRRDGLVLTARMGRSGSSSREPIRYGEESWEGPIFLPPTNTTNRRRRSWFAARLAGDTHVYPFDPTQDEVAVTPSPRHPLVQLLADSNFSGQEWIVRESALHARSKTFTQKDSILVAKVEAPVLETLRCG